MGWILFLAHFLGDFVLQTEWMVLNRHKLWVLSLHAGTHLGLMLLLVGQSRSLLWPYFLLISLIHFFQDYIKIRVTRKKPEWMTSSFIVDQLLHYALLVFAVVWIQKLDLPFDLPEKSPLVVSATALVLVTFVWFVAERMFNLKNVDYLDNINQTKYSRMMTRAGLVVIFLMVRTLAVPTLAMFLTNPYPESTYRRRAIIVDLSVSAIAIIFLLFVI